MNIEQLMSIKLAGYKIIYNYETGFCIYLGDKLLYTSNKFANQFENEMDAHLSIMEEYFSSKEE